MTSDLFGNLGLPLPFDANGSSFFELLRRVAPDAVPRTLGDGPGPEPHGVREAMVQGTTVLAVTFRDGVVVAGDRRATAGHLISKKDMRKVFPADTYSAVAISGVAGPAMELAKVFATELEHYEKVEGEPLSLEGKANKLAHMVRANLPLALQGFVVVPLFAGVEARTTSGRIFEYDPAGGRYLTGDYASAGSGGRDTRGVLKREHDPDADEETSVRLCVSALFDAAEEDSATGGPDLIRRIYPIVAVITSDGYRELDEEGVGEHVEAVVSLREERANNGHPTLSTPLPTRGSGARDERPDEP
ncbi:MAG: proteasome subunit beta [Actinomycetota bacterium]|nr:proteasome subunit beta [Actinomycetota bacterium]